MPLTHMKFFNPTRGEFFEARMSLTFEGENMKRASIAFCLFAVVSIALSTTGSAQQTQIPNRQMTKIEELIYRYFDSLNETDSKRRRDLTKQVWAERGKFGAPSGEVEGHDVIVALVEGVQKQFPEGRRQPSALLPRAARRGRQRRFRRALRQLSPDAEPARRTLPARRAAPASRKGEAERAAMAPASRRDADGV